MVPFPVHETDGRCVALQPACPRRNLLNQVVSGYVVDVATEVRCGRSNVVIDSQRTDPSRSGAARHRARPDRVARGVGPLRAAAAGGGARSRDAACLLASRRRAAGSCSEPRLVPERATAASTAPEPAPRHHPALVRSRCCSRPTARSPTCSTAGRGHRHARSTTSCACLGCALTDRGEVVGRAHRRRARAARLRSTSMALPGDARRSPARRCARRRSSRRSRAAPHGAGRSRAELMRAGSNRRAIVGTSAGARRRSRDRAGRALGASGARSPARPASEKERRTASIVAGATRQLIHVNCAALPSRSRESELFGHVAGRASPRRAGKFEIGRRHALPRRDRRAAAVAESQKLLRCRPASPAGVRSRTADVRVIAAVNPRPSDRTRTLPRDLFHGPRRFLCDRAVPPAASGMAALRHWRVRISADAWSCRRRTTGQRASFENVLVARRFSRPPARPRRDGHRRYGQLDLPGRDDAATSVAAPLRRREAPRQARRCRRSGSPSLLRERRRPLPARADPARGRGHGSWPQPRDLGPNRATCTPRSGLSGIVAEVGFATEDVGCRNTTTRAAAARPRSTADARTRGVRAVHAAEIADAALP